MAGHAYTATVPRAPGEHAGAGEARSSLSPLPALALAAACVPVLALVWVVAELVPQAHYRDALLLHEFTMHSGPRVDQVGEYLLSALAPLPFTIWGIAIVAVAFARRRPRLAAAAVLVMSMAPFTAETLKPLTAHSHVRLYALQIGPASWPSGHSTAALALALAALIVTAPRWRALVGLLGALFALAVGCFLLILAWHMPSDVLAGYLVAIMWAALAVGAVRASELRWPSGASR